MTYEDITRVNGTLTSMDIKGKDYVLVNERIKAFRMLYPEGTIETQILDCTDGIVTMKAVVSVDGKVLGTGHAQEKESSSYINKTSYIENCETSAVGRALGMLGIGIDTAVASYEEVANAVENQKPVQKTKAVERSKTSDIYSQDNGKPASPKQLYLLDKLGYKGPVDGLTMKQASAEIEKINEANRGK